ncbi:MAG: LysR family transcriptional regulator [Pseudomonadota bacterium]
MIDRYRQLAIFLRTVQLGSFRNAAKALDLSPSVVSHHVSQLEKHLGVALIYRSTRKLTLTPEGERLMVSTQAMLDAVDKELIDISGSSSEPSGELRVTLPSVLSDSVVADRLATFLVRYPRIHLTVDFSDTRKALIDDGFDVAIRLMRDAPVSPNVRVLTTIERRLVVTQPYWAGRASVNHPDDLEDWDWLALAPVHLRGISFARSGAGSVTLKPKVRLQSNDARALLKLVEAGLGIAALPEFLTDEPVKAGILKYVLPDWRLGSLSLCAEWPSNAPRNGLVHLFVNAMDTL